MWRSATRAEDPLGTGLLDPEGWSGEETLDVEAVHAMAPGAGIYYVGAVSPLNATLLVAEAQAIEDGTAQVVSNSWGSSSDSPDPADKAIFDRLTADAAATGVTVAYSTGDSGDQTATGGTRTADYPATSDMVVAVGGTTLKVLSGNRYGRGLIRPGGTLFDIPRDPRLNHRIEVASGVLAKECGDLLTQFFRDKRGR